MKEKSSKLYRKRFFLKSPITTIALPFLQSLSGSSVFASDVQPGVANPGLQPTTGSPKSPSGIPRRFIALPMGYGVNGHGWFPSLDQIGKDYQLPSLVKPFEAVKEDITFLQNLLGARVVGPHNGTTNFLTCKPGGARVDRKFENTVSCDQLAAEILGQETRFDYLALGSSGGPDGHGGYASWDRAGKPVGLHRTTTEIYTALFGNGGNPAKLRAQLAHEQSSLDALMSEAKTLNRQVSAEDRDRVDEYFTTIRNIETRLTKAQKWTDKPYPKAPFEIPTEEQDIGLVLDMMLIALQSDSTRVMTYMLPTAPVIKMIGARSNPHRMSHAFKEEWNPQNPSIHQQRDLYFAEMVAGFIKKLKDSKEADGSSLLDHTLLAYGSSLRHGHNSKNGPMILAGYGGGEIKQGQNLNMDDTPLANLWLSILRHIGVQQDQFGDSTGVIKEMGFS